MPSTKEVLAIAIEEQRRVAGDLRSDYEGLKTRILTYLAAGLAVLTFLYSRGPGTFIPGATYGKIFYFAALGMTIGSIGVLLFGLIPTDWHVPTENAKLALLDESNEVQYLTYVKDRYVDCFKNNIQTYNRKQKLVDVAFFPLIIGATMLIILNLFGGQ